MTPSFQHSFGFESPSQSAATPACLPEESIRTETEQALERHQWDFPNSKSSRSSIHSIHPYPAKFIPEIPKAIISEFPPPEGSVVLDPFCGSGTSLVEARNAGFDAVGIDLNPIACLISRVKTTTCPELLGLAAARCRDKAAALNGTIPDDIPNLNHWFEPHVSEAVSSLIHAIRSESPQDCLDALELALSSILVRVSNQDSDTRYAAVRKQITAKQVLDLFCEAAGRIETALRSCPKSTHRAEVVESDILQVKPEMVGRRVGLVVTSPPYPNAYEYWLYHKYRMWWLGHDALRVKEREIGARSHFFGGGAKAQDFERQMAGVFQLLDHVCVEGATICFVVGDSKIHGQIVDNAEALKNAAAGSGFGVEGHVMRNMRGNKKSFNLAHARIRQEHILVFKRHRCA
jgi:site-specific DNA-methyltransferase (cytosine-N4-specific)